MKTYEIDIELLSDLCASDGGVYNSSIDADLCYDEYGFPYIPAKRLKGSLRECAEELNDWGIQIPEGRLFGEEGNRPGAMRIGNAYLKNYSRYRREVRENQGFVLTHPQNVLREFTYMRSQTAIDLETGTAKDRSLRVIRLANKGLHFVAEVMMPEQDFPFLSKCCLALKSLGLAGTRGLGEVSVRIDEKEEKSGGPAEACPWTDHAVKLEYEITLTEPMLCKGIGGGEEQTEDYIEGAKILGLIAQASKMEGEGAFLTLMDEGDLICSNAYLSKNGSRLSPVPACYYSIKHSKDTFVDKSSLGYGGEKDTERQLLQMNGYYAPGEQDGSLLCHSVQIEERYHHRRSDDKSVGRATGNGMDGSVFYQTASISPGQSFRGWIEGSETQIKKVYGYLMDQPVIHLGAGRGAEYGEARIAVTGLFEQAQVKKDEVGQLIVKLEAPLILYGKNAACTADPQELIQEINAVLGVDEEQVETIDRSIRLTTVGGYHVTWNMKKPVLKAFDKGTVLCYRLKRPMDLPLSSVFWVGERVNEGYGEVTVRRPAKGNGERARLSAKEPLKGKMIDINRTEFLNRLCTRLFSDYIASEGIRICDELRGRGEVDESLKPTVNNMLGMCEEMNDFEQIEAACKDRFMKKSDEKEKKHEISRSILEDCRKHSEPLSGRFQETFRIRGYECRQETVRKLFLKAYLQEMRYLLHTKEGGEDDEECGKEA